VSRQALCHLAVALHGALSSSLGILIISVGLDPLPLAAIGFIALSPAALALPGLMAGRPEAMRWIAVLLVLYAGLGAVEVVARGHPAAIALLLFALVELALVLSLTRSPPPRGPRAAAES
jgi:hypothetical protein